MTKSRRGASAEQRTQLDSELEMESARLAERYLDFWQRNMMTWLSDPELVQNWSRRIMEQDKTREPGQDDNA